MNLGTALRLGRVSNLPTVWTNVAAGMVLAGATPRAASVLLLGIAASAFYVGGMFLNDAYDAEIDAAQRPDRPIAAGEVDRDTVMRAGYGLLAAGLCVVVVHGLTVATVSPWGGLLAGAATCGAIVLYDRWHKGNPIAPVIMGLCRVGVYATAALAVAPRVSGSVWLGAALLAGYVVGLTHVARHEDAGQFSKWWPLAALFAPILYVLPGGSSLLLRALIGGFALWVFRALDLVRRGEPAAIKRAVVSLIAGISLLDALLLARHGHSQLALLAVAAFGLTLVLQRRVAGT